VLDSSHKYSCTTAEQFSHSSYKMAVRLQTGLACQPGYWTVQHDIWIKNQHSAVGAWKMSVYLAEFWLPLWWSYSEVTLAPPPPPPNGMCRGQAISHCLWCVLLWNNEWETFQGNMDCPSRADEFLNVNQLIPTTNNLHVIQRNQCPLCMELPYIVHSEENPLTYWHGCMPHYHAARMVTALFYSTVTTSK
jgi:hypothetical protein